MDVESSKVVSTSSELFFETTEHQNSGTYICIAKNVAGEAYKEISLQVQLPPRIKKPGIVNYDNRILSAKLNFPFQFFVKPSGQQFEFAESLISNVKAFSLAEGW